MTEINPEFSPSLSNREEQVLRLLVRGCSNKAIACELGVSVETVKTHMKRILSKMNVPKRKQAAQKAIQCGLVPVDEQ